MSRLSHATWLGLLMACLLPCLGADGCGSGSSTDVRLVVKSNYGTAVAIYDNGTYLGTVPASTGWKWKISPGSHTITCDSSATSVSASATGTQRISVIVDGAGDLQLQ